MKIRKLISILIGTSILITTLFSSVSSYAIKSPEGRSKSAEVLAEGAVLLKNDNNALPLSKGANVAVYGNAQIDCLVGGGGSSVMFTDYTVSPLEGLEEAEKEGKINLHKDTKDQYKLYVDEKQQLKAIWGTDAFYEKYVSKSIEMKVTARMVLEATETCDTAIFFISRYATEGGDMKAEKGGYYLSDDEEEILGKLTENFEKTIVILNIPSAIDLSKIAGDDAVYDVDAILSVWYPGEDAGNVIADLLTGDITPSGKLSQTFAKSYEDYYSSQNWNNKNTVLYEEDIFVGYRQFMTFNKDRILFPFGYGLSYTKFSLLSVDFVENDGKIMGTFKVKNTGSYSGKEVLQVYGTAPNDILGNPSAELCAFVKTPLMAPGEEATVSCDFLLSDLAAYDDLGKIQKSCYILEKGDYKFYLGNSVRDAYSRNPMYSINISENVITAECSECCPSTRLSKRLTSTGEYETLEKRKAENDSKQIEGYVNPDEGYSGEKITLKDLYNDRTLMSKFLAQLTIKEMAQLAGGTDGSGLGYIAGTCSGKALSEYGGVEIFMTDGGQGLRVMSLATYFPSGTCLACTFNTELAREYGEVIGEECVMSGIDIWLGPGMNIIRNPLCGRNFEYYSEDPYLTGKIAASVTLGVQSRNVAVCPKHYVANNMEQNRGPQNSVVSERALREIYLKGFEILIKEANPWVIMTTCGTVNSSGAAGNYDLMTEIPRNEWHWDGVFISDWANMDDEVAELKAGHNIGMPHNTPNVLVNAEKKGRITRAQLEENSRKIIELILKLHSQRRLLDPDYQGVVVNISCKEDVTIRPSLFATSVGIEDSYYKQDGNLETIVPGGELNYYVESDAGFFTMTLDFSNVVEEKSIDVLIDGERVDGVDTSKRNVVKSSVRNVRLSKGVHKITIKSNGYSGQLGNMIFHETIHDKVKVAGKDLSVGLIIGIVSIVVVILTAIAVVIVILSKKRRTK